MSFDRRISSFDVDVSRTNAPLAPTIMLKENDFPKRGNKVFVGFCSSRPRCTEQRKMLILVFEDLALISPRPNFESFKGLLSRWSSSSKQESSGSMSKWARTTLAKTASPTLRRGLFFLVVPSKERMGNWAGSEEPRSILYPSALLELIIPTTKSLGAGMY